MTWTLVDERRSPTTLVREFCWGGGRPHFWVEVFVTDQPPTAGQLAVQVSWQEDHGTERVLTDSWPATLLPEVMASVVKGQRLLGIKALPPGFPTPFGPFGNRDLALEMDLDNGTEAFPALDQESPLADDYVLGQIMATMEAGVPFGGYMADDAVRATSPGQVVVYPDGNAWDEDEYVFVSVEHRERWTRQERGWRLEFIRNLTPQPSVREQEYINRQITRLVLRALHDLQDQDEAGAV